MTGRAMSAPANAPGKTGRVTAARRRRGEHKTDRAMTVPVTIGHVKTAPGVIGHR
jgi:hypothetical protein